jgi:hypothetical protein
MFDWYLDIVPLLTNTTTKSIDKGTKVSVPFRHFRPYPMIPNEQNNIRWSGNNTMKYNHQANHAEVNHTLVVDQYIYGAVNDNFGCYKWDIQTCQIVTTYTIPNACNNSLFAMEYISSTNVLLTGGENGELGIWDVKTNCLIDVINVNSIVELQKGSNIIMNNSNLLSSNQSRRLNINNNNNSSNHSSTSSRVWISTCIAWKDQWWIVGGGFHRPSEEYNSHNGYIAIFHGPTRTVLSCMTTVGQIQNISLYNPTMYNDNGSCIGNSATFDETHLIALSNTNYIYQWTNPLSVHVTPQQRVYCYTPSAYAVAVEKNNTINAMFAVGGVGSRIDIFDHSSQLCQQLTT